MSRVEVLSGPERRRRWSEDQKRAIVAEAFAPGASVSAVARRLDVVAGQIYRWRRDLGSARRRDLPRWWSRRRRASRLAVIAPAVEIELGRDIRVRIPMTTPKELASAVIRALAAR